LPGHVQVQQDDARPRGTRRVGVLPPAVQIVEQLLAVLDEPQVVDQVALGERLLRQGAVVRVVIGHEDRYRPGPVSRHSSGPRLCVLRDGASGDPGPAGGPGGSRRTWSRGPACWWR